jgi:hypothetical protein
MTAEEQKAFDEAKAAADNAAKLKAELEEYKKNNPPKSKEDDPTILEAARKKEGEEADRKAKEKAISEAAKFSVSIRDIIAGGEEFFPKEIAGIMEVNAKKPYDSEIDKANDLRATIIESVFSVQKNLDLLSEVAREKINVFLSLSQKKREDKAHEHWEYVLTALDTYKRVSKLERAQKTRSGLASPSDAQEAYDKKILGLRDKPQTKEN